jgi:hypothetical protein
MRKTFGLVLIFAIVIAGCSASSELPLGPEASLFITNQSDGVLCSVRVGGAAVDAEMVAPGEALEVGESVELRLAEGSVVSINVEACEGDFMEMAEGIVMVLEGVTYVIGGN